MAKRSTLDSKKNMVLNCIRLGMEKYRVYLLLEFTDRQITTLDGDDYFQRQIEATETALERDLLEKYATIIDASLQKGSPAAIQWMLSKINAPRWGSKVEVSPGETGAAKVNIYLPDNKRG